MSSSRYRAWGFRPESDQSAVRPQWRQDVDHCIQQNKQTRFLPFGNGRSYGDSCLNSGGQLLDAGALNRFLEFDSVSGVLKAEAGLRLETILEVIVPRGWFLPVSPGTAKVSLGGAIANDVHGKNHHCDGTIGRFVKSFELLRSNGEELHCSDTVNQALYQATIGGLGLTGFITAVSLQLQPIRSSNMDVQLDAFQGLDEFAELSAKRKDDHQYTVAWLDCASSGSRFGRGIFLSANHSSNGELVAARHTSKLSVPFAMPAWSLNAYSVRAFNALYHYKLSRRNGQQFEQAYQPYFYPLDAVAKWNRIYGARGFYQYQFVVPLKSLNVLETILKAIVASGMGSFLAVLKEFGDIPSPGMLSFPRQGYCLALDFANRGAKSERLIQALDEHVMACGGAAYPAKDRLMSAKAFAQYFPRMSEFESHIDPQFTSDFWERVRG